VEPGSHPYGRDGDVEESCRHPKSARRQSQRLPKLREAAIGDIGISWTPVQKPEGGDPMPFKAFCFPTGPPATPAEGLEALVDPVS